MKGRPALVLLLIFASGLALGIAVKAYFFSTPPRPAKQVRPVVSQAERAVANATVSAEDVELVQGRDGVMQWKILAAEAKYNQEMKYIVVKRPQLQAYFGKDRQEVYVKAATGEVDQQNDNLMLHDEVKGRFGPFTLDAGQLDYVGAIEKVYLKGGVAVKRPDMLVKAMAVEIDLVSRQMIAAGGVTALLAPEGIEESPFYEAQNKE
ncbi:LPS export ABC transporter periplasmic protein LptC [Pseudodesulfovibrio tunisiensis]|uniref:LPS export ABC transporter periplasmic protein LptC n=1 Tax=Pseudodesulfovibrio tunisiensis TaxID=463192 RepID=UPI001FB1A970|nr:LPS export ABC transporter periplasmic protein LptC [Pseudodesulfovibrio tunisiensis]